MKNLISLDFKTGSANQWDCAITQVGVARFVSGTLLESWREVIKPTFGSINPAYLFNGQGTTYAELEKNGKPFLQVAARLSNFLHDARRQSPELGDLVICGYSFYDFDLRVLERFWKESEDDVSPYAPDRVFDTMEVSRALMALDIVPPGAWNLRAMCNWYGIEHKGHHNPEDEAIAAGYLALRLSEEIRGCR